jgi:hypothetical protein
MAWMFEKEMTLEELNEVWKESVETEHVIKKNMPMRLYNMAKETYERDQFDEKVIDKMYESDRRKVQKIYKIDDNSAIVETFEKLFGEKEKLWYRVYLNGHVDSTVTTSFDNALIRLVALKHNCAEATGWISKMLDIKEDID